VNDNGIGWGAHRLRGKGHPYANHLIGYVRWPGRWGDVPAVVDGYTPLIDWAPTLAEVGGATLGPYPMWSGGPDGRSLVALLDGGDPPDRDALLEEHRDDVLHVPAGMPAWWGLRTTDGRWHYIEYDTGETELYDLAADPGELVNVWGTDDPEVQDASAMLGTRLDELRAP
jgi:arylsulfatase A-like enzyme